MKPVLQPLCALRPSTGTVPVGDDGIASHLPGRGLPLGCLHEVMGEMVDREMGALGAAMIAGFAGRIAPERPVLWVGPRDDLYAPGLAAWGLDPGRLVRAEADTDSEILGAVELGLREGGFAAVVGEVDQVGRLAGRRLHLACQKRGVTCFVLRRRVRPRDVRRVEVREGNAAATRWRVSPAPSVPEWREPGRPRWRVELLHARGGRDGSWMVEVEDAPFSLRVASAFPDSQAAPKWRVAG